MYWRPTGNEREIELYFRVAFVHPFFTVTNTNEDGEDCTPESIRDQTPLDTGLKFKWTVYYEDGSTKKEDVSGGKDAFYTCTDIRNGTSAESRWASGYNRSIIKLPEGDNSLQWIIRQDSCCWTRKLINYESPRNWRMPTLVDLTPRLDLGGVPNSSPKLQGLPIKTVTHKCISFISINAIDDDGDILRCRWTESLLIECKGNCGNPDPGIFTMQNDKCKIKVDPRNAKIGLYAVAVIVEDFPRGKSESKAFSKIPYQFIVQIQKKDVDCDDVTTEIDKTCHAVPVDDSSLFRMKLYGRTQNPTVPIRSIDMITQPGMRVSDLKDDGNGRFYVKLKWIVPASMRGKVEQLCYQAVDYNEVAGQEVCVGLYVGGVVPKPIKEISTPSSNTSHVVNPGNHQWKLFFTHPVQLGEDFQRSDVHFLLEDRTVAHSLPLSPKNTVISSEEPYFILFDTPEFYLEEKTTYIISLEEGLVFGTEGCRVPSEGAEWAFTTGNYPLEVKTPGPTALTIECFPTSMVVYIEKDVFPGVNTSLLISEDPDCQAIDYNETYLAIHTTYGKCGTYAVVNEDASRVSLINTLYLPRTDQSPSGDEVTRSESYEVRINCSIPAERASYVEFSTNTSTPVIQRNNVGDFDFSLKMFRDETYESHYGVSDYPVYVDEDTRLYLQAQLFPPSPRRSPFLEECVATPTYDSEGHHRHTIIRDGCPVDKSVDIYDDSPTSTVRFSMKAFSFIGTNLQHSVFVFCKYRYCNPKRNCKVNCPDIGTQSDRVQERGSSFVRVEEAAEWTN